MNDAATRAVAAAGPGVAASVGALLSYPPIIGVSACILVRLPLFKFKSWVADVCLTGLATLGTYVTIVDHDIASGSAFWVGIGFGAMGSTIIEIGKSAVTGAFKERFQAAGKILFGIKPDA